MAAQAPIEGCDRRVGIVLGGALLVLAACGRQPPPARERPPTATESAADSGRTSPPAEPRWREVAAATGLDFVHHNGMTGEYYYHEIFGSGVALVDYDGDDDLDVYLVQSGPIGAAAGEQIPGDRLYRNDLGRAADGSPRLRFVDVTREAGIEALGYGMGVATGDYDNDGWVDLYLTNYGANQLWRNRGDGTFEDVTEKSATGDPRWGVAAVFFDYDRDGWLDLFVGNYLHYSVATHERCSNALGGPNWCGPLSYLPQPDLLLHNRRDGTFEEVTGAAGLGGSFGRTLGAIAADFDLDGWPDLYVANDASPNLLWINRRDGSFAEGALIAGCAVNERGHSEGSMGVDAADIDGDGDEDLFMTHITEESNTLFVNDGQGQFTDRTMVSGLGSMSLELTGFGVGWLDFDLDGWLDAVAVNGAVRTLEALVLAGDPFPIHQPNLLIRNRGDGTFAEVTAEAGPAFALSEVSRGAAFGDLDNDGDPDVVISNNNGPVRLLQNVGSRAGRWIGLRLVGSEVDRDLLGAWVGVSSGAGRSWWRRVRTARSYASASDPRLLYALPAATRTVSARVLWPDGRWEAFVELPTDRYSLLRQGEGEALP